MKAIIIPVANTRPDCYDYLHRLLDSMQVNGYFKDSDFQTFLALDNCDQEFQGKLVDFFGGLPINVISNNNPINLNFCRNANSGLRFAYTSKDNFSHFAVLNMDTELPALKYFDKVSGKGLSSPKEVNTHDEPVGLGNERVEVDRFGGFCMVMSRELIDKIGFLDERFSASFEDDDLCVRAHLAGFPVESVNCHVFHATKDRKEVSTTGAYDMNTLALHMQIFRRKWSIPPQIEHKDMNKWIRDHHDWTEEMKCE